MAPLRDPGTLFGYIGGTSFSGSTLLSLLLDAQPGVTSVGEVAWNVRDANSGSYPCSCGEKLDSCPFWSDVGRAMQRRNHRFDADHWDTAFEVTGKRLLRKLAVRSLGANSAEQLRDRLVSILPRWGARLADIGKRNAALVSSILSITGAAAFVDASKDPNRIRFLRHYSGIDPYVIHLVRDSPAFVNSAIKKDQDPMPVDTAIRWWNGTLRQMERLRRTMPKERWLVVRYEDLCANPGCEVQRVLRFLGVADGSPVLDYRSNAHHVIGNRMRLGESSEIRLDVSWRDELSKHQLARITESTTKYRQVFGYLDGTGRRSDYNFGVPAKSRDPRLG